MRITPALVALCIACPGPPLKGDEQMGVYQFRAEPDGGDCPFPAEIPDAGFNFEATFSRDRDGGGAWVTIGGVAHDATFDGQKMFATYGAQRNFSECACGTGFTVTMTETIHATLVSKSQSDAVGGCVLDPPFDPDAGITRPGSAASGFDAVRACGSLTEEIAISPAVTQETMTCLLRCNGCSLGYAIAGDRK